MYRKLVICIIATMLIPLVFNRAVYAAESYETERIRFHFRFDKTAVDTSYMSNAESWNQLVGQFNRPGKIEQIQISVVSSPEGAVQRNSYLASERAKAISDFIIKVAEGRIDSTDIHIAITDENWEGLAEAVRNSYNRHDRDKVLKIISTEGISDATREWRLNRLDNGYTWGYLKRIYCPSLREACIVSIRFRKTEQVVPVTDTCMVFAESLREISLIMPEIQVGSSAIKTPLQPVALSLRSNILYDAALIPNIGAEVQFGEGWSVGASWGHAWWSISKSHIFWRVYGGEVDVRRYFGRQAKARPFSGHHAGIYGQIFTYDLEAGGRGMQSLLSYGTGIEYGYSMPVTNSLNIDFELGLGYIGGEYKLYDPEDGCYVWKETRIRHFYGPTKIGVSLVWRFDTANFRRKGGER